MSFIPGSGRGAYGQGSTGARWVRRLVLLAFALIQLVLVARILLDLGVIPADWGIAERVVSTSDALAAPVQGLSDWLGGPLGSGAGEGFNAVMLAALAGWTVVEGLVMRVVGKLAAAMA
jgi:hypothetical protein